MHSTVTNELFPLNLAPSLHSTQSQTIQASGSTAYGLCILSAKKRKPSYKGAQEMTSCGQQPQKFKTTFYFPQSLHILTEQKSCWFIKCGNIFFAMSCHMLRSNSISQLQQAASYFTHLRLFCVCKSPISLANFLNGHDPQVFL